MEQHRNIELRSRKVQHIVGKVPPVIERYGLSFIALAIALLFVVSLLVPYRRDVPLCIDFAPQSSPCIGAAKVDPDTRQLLTEGMPVFIDVFGTQQKGSITHIDSIRTDGRYHITILLPDERLSMHYTLQGYVSIMNQSLFDKVFGTK